MKAGMVRLLVRIIVTRQGTGADSIVSSAQANGYDPELLDALVNTVLDETLSSLGLSSFRELSRWVPEISVTLRVYKEKVRPSLHLEQGTIMKLAEAGATFDFDPYT